jgi:hypothetical protein
MIFAVNVPKCPLDSKPGKQQTVDAVQWGYETAT